MKHILSAIAVVLCSFGPAQAQDGDIRSVIQNQLEAFQADDMDTAFGFASDNVKLFFRDSERFGIMVRNGYPMVYRPQSYAFQELREIEGQLFQQVQIEDANGRFFIIQYAMIETNEGWKINGVELFQSDIVGA